MTEFEHLHTHTHFSLLDGLSTIPSIVEKAFEMDRTSVAITDHGSIAGVPELFRTCKEYGLKPIAGMEAYICDDIQDREQRDNDRPYYHTTLLAMDITGYQNLCRLVTASFRDGFYRRPRIDFNLLSQHHRGLFCLSGCIGGPTQQFIIRGDNVRARKYLDLFLQIFGSRRFILEMQDTGISDQKVVNTTYSTWARKDKLRLVATSDSHYTHESDAHGHEVLLCVGTRSKMSDPNRYKFNGHGYHYKSADEMLKLFDKRILLESHIIAEQCERYDLPKTGTMPTFTEHGDADQYVKKLAFVGLQERKLSNKKEYIQRLYHELGVVKQLGFSSYFLIVMDIIQNARRMGVLVGPGRGSSAGSLLAYCLGITTIDPLKHGLYFERFLNRDRIAPPDIDVDFADSGRHLVLDYIRSRYGYQNVAHIASFNTLGPRQTVRDVASVMGHDERTIREALQHVSHDPMLKYDEIRDDRILYSKLGNDVMDVCNLLAEKNRHLTTHASGIIISDRPLEEDIPLMITKDGDLQTHYSEPELAKLGYVKFDVLGLKTLGIIDNVMKNTHVDWAKMNELNDSFVYDLISAGDTLGVFQLESWGYQKFCKQFKPRNFEDLMMINALYRPGPMQGGEGLESILRRRFGQEQESYIDVALQPILGWTYGMPIYQEQIMQICSDVAGFTLARADTMRAAISKKKEEELLRLRSEFIAGCIKNGRSRDIAEQLFQQIEFFARYGWNKAHAASYGTVTYYTAYLKRYHAPYYYAEMLNSENDAERTGEILMDAHRHDISFSKIHINTAKRGYVVVNGKIMPGITSIKGVGDRAADAILAGREANGGQFYSIQQFRQHVPPKSCNKTMFEVLRKAGAFDDIPEVQPDVPF